MNKLFVLIQTLVPQHALSRLVAVFANSKVGFIKDTFIRGFIKRYKVDMSEARFSDVGNYNSFNEAVEASNKLKKRVYIAYTLRFFEHESGNRK